MTGLLEPNRLEPYLEQRDVTDIRVCGSEPVWLSLQSGQEVRAEPIVDSDEELVELVRGLARGNGEERRWDEAAPKVDFQLPDGSRVYAIGWVTPCPTVFVRRRQLVSTSERGRVDL